ncbi:MAG: hypothetical protein JW871_02060 [Endomicrobiales bacterium]|nr:hypothetical protein [Endomicrobiales bacterium]
MIKVKSNDVITLIDILKDNDGRNIGKIRRNLSTQALKIFSSKKFPGLISQKIEEEIFITSALILFPDSPHKMWKLGELLARKNMNTIYRLFMRLSSPSYGIKKAPIIWDKFYRSGKLKVVNTGKKSANMIVTGFPQMRPYQIDLTCGYICVILELAGAKNIKVNVDSSDSNAWKWDIYWN